MQTTLRRTGVGINTTEHKKKIVPLFGLHLFHCQFSKGLSFALKGKKRKHGAQKHLASVPNYKMLYSPPPNCPIVSQCKQKDFQNQREARMVLLWEENGKKMNAAHLSSFVCRSVLIFLILLCSLVYRKLQISSG